MQEIEVGAVVEAVITGITNFGAFAELPGKKVGMIHISEISRGFVKSVSDVISVGQKLNVKVISIDERGKIALSLKALAVENANEKRSAPPVEYTPVKKKEATPKEELDPFEAMMLKFKNDSNEKISDLKRSFDSKRSGAGYSRRGSKKF